MHISKVIIIILIAGGIFFLLGQKTQYFSEEVNKIITLLQGQSSSSEKDTYLMQIANDDKMLSAYFKQIGLKGVFKKLTAESTLVSSDECHIKSHNIGKIAFRLYKGETFKEVDYTCFSGVIHGAMEAFITETGGNNIAHESQALCDTLSTDFDTMQCIHGIGHGVMIYYDYNLPQALDTCELLRDDVSKDLCFAGVFMENVSISEGIRGTIVHTSKWSSKNNFFYPCTDPAVTKSKRTEAQCYKWQSWKIALTSQNNFDKISAFCHSVPSDMKRSCFDGMGREASLKNLYNYEKINDICQKAPAQYYRTCIASAIFPIIELWGFTITDQGAKLCNTVTKSDQQLCYQALGTRLGLLFGKDTQNINKPQSSEYYKKIMDVCSYAKAEYNNTCLRGAGIK